MQTKLFINGEFISGEGRDEVILDPATGERIVTILTTGLSPTSGLPSRRSKVAGKTRKELRSVA
ncbi:MAG: hypothetical protein GY850_18700 [bacterium]|nr:hypothetical protein [bacterium]